MQYDVASINVFPKKNDAPKQCGFEAEWRHRGNAFRRNMVVAGKSHYPGAFSLCNCHILSYASMQWGYVEPTGVGFSLSFFRGGMIGEICVLCAF